LVIRLIPSILKTAWTLTVSGYISAALAHIALAPACNRIITLTLALIAVRSGTCRRPECAAPTDGLTHHFGLLPSKSQFFIICTGLEAALGSKSRFFSGLVTVSVRKQSPEVVVFKTYDY